MSNAIQQIEQNADNNTALALQALVSGGDLSQLSPVQLAGYYKNLCDSLGLNWLTLPFAVISANGKKIMYAKKEATDQIRKRDKVNLGIAERTFDNNGGVYTVVVKASTPDGREDESTGVVPTAGLKGEALANALMKAETKAKRRATLSIVGLGWMDESETESVSNARPVRMEMKDDGLYLDADDPKEVAALGKQIRQEMTRIGLTDDEGKAMVHKVCQKKLADLTADDMRTLLEELRGIEPDDNGPDGAGYMIDPEEDAIERAKMTEMAKRLAREEKKANGNRPEETEEDVPAAGDSFDEDLLGEMRRTVREIWCEVLDRAPDELDAACIERHGVPRLQLTLEQARKMVKALGKEADASNQ